MVGGRHHENARTQANDQSPHISGWNSRNHIGNGFRQYFAGLQRR